MDQRAYRIHKDVNILFFIYFIYFNIAFITWCNSVYSWQTRTNYVHPAPRWGRGWASGHQWGCSLGNYSTWCLFHGRLFRWKNLADLRGQRTAFDDRATIGVILVACHESSRFVEHFRHVFREIVTIAVVCSIGGRQTQRARGLRFRRIPENRMHQSISIRQCADSPGTGSVRPASVFRRYVLGRDDDIYPMMRLKIYLHNTTAAGSLKKASLLF